MELQKRLWYDECGSSFLRSLAACSQDCVKSMDDRVMSGSSGDTEYFRDARRIARQLQIKGQQYYYG